LKLVAADGFLHKTSPIAVIDLLELEFPFNFVTTTLDILFVGEELHTDDLKIRGSQLD